MLKTLIILLLCLILLLQPVNNLLVVFSYVINKEFIAAVLCINRDIPDNDCEGSCQVTEQLNEQEKKKKEPGGILSNKIDISLFLPVSILNLNPPIEIENYITTCQNNIPDVPPFAIFHPPRAIG